VGAESAACPVGSARARCAEATGRARRGGRSIDDVRCVARALSDENRIRTLMFLRGGELCVCQIIEMLGLAPSTISEHMAVLHRAGLVEARKEGRWIFYRLADRGGSGAARRALRWIRDSLAGDRLVCGDAKRLRWIRRTPIKELCGCYKPGRCAKAAARARTGARTKR
jgi:ArsR family transcriptional regulator